MINMGNVGKVLTKATGRAGILLRKHSPEILLVVGIVGVVGSAVLACKATLKVEEVLDEHRAKADKIKDAWDKVESGDISLDTYSERDHQKDLVVTYVQTAMGFVKLYGPAVSLGIFSIACIVGGHGIMRRRNVALVAAYKAVEEGFNAYRKRVIEEHGEELDYAYKNGLKVERVTETVVGEDGKSRKVKKDILTPTDPNGYSMYARFYDDGCTQWSKDPSYNMLYLRSQQNYFNELLQTRGHVFLNEVYDALGIDRTNYGQIVGWVFGGDGNNFIDFGIFNGDSPEARRFVNGYERSILLDFNVDGVVYDLI